MSLELLVWGLPRQGSRAEGRAGAPVPSPCGRCRADGRCDAQKGRGEQGGCWRGGRGWLLPQELGCGLQEHPPTAPSISCLPLAAGGGHASVLELGPSPTPGGLTTTGALAGSRHHGPERGHCLPRALKTKSLVQVPGGASCSAGAAPSSPGCCSCCQHPPHPSFRKKKNHKMKKVGGTGRTVF